MVTLFGTIAVLYFARGILIPLAFALTLTFVLTPVVALLERSRIGRLPSVAVTVLVTMAAAGCVGGIIAIQFVDVARSFPGTVRTFKPRWKRFAFPRRDR